MEELKKNTEKEEIQNATHENSDVSKKEKYSYLKWLKRIVTFIGILFGSIVLFLLAVAYLYGDEIKQYAVDQLNKKLNVKVSVEDIEFTVFEQFPQASLKFHNTFINDRNSENEKDTLFYAENIYFNFNFWSILDGEYIVKKVKCENSFINLGVNIKGQENYSILKEDSTAQEDNKFSFELKNVEFEKLRLNYNNDYNNQYYSIHTDELYFSGDFSASTYDLEAQSSLHIDQVKIDEINYLDGKDAELAINIQVNNDSNTFSIADGSLKVAEAKFQVNGLVKNDSITQGSKVDFDITTNNMGFADLFSLLPQDYSNVLNAYEADGLIRFNASIEGEISKTTQPKVLAEFFIENGSMTEKTTKEILSNITLNGEFISQNKKGKSALNINHLTADLSDGKLGGSIKINDLQNQKIQLNIKANLGLNKVVRFFNIESIGSADGNLIINSAIALENKKEKLILKATDGALALKNGSVKFKYIPFSIEELGGIAKLNKDNLVLSNLNFKIYDDQYTTSFQLNNFLNYVTKNNPLNITGNIKNDKLDLGSLLVTNKIEKLNQPYSGTAIQLPTNVSANINFSSQQLKFGKFIAKNLSSKLIYNDHKISLNNTSFTANKGSYKLNTSIEQVLNSKNKVTYIWDAKVNAQQVDFSDFFYSFDNFSQDYLTDKNIKGKGNVNIAFSSLLLNDFSIIDSSIVAIADIDIAKGVLKNQSTLLELGEYLDKNKIVSKIVDTKSLNKKLQNVKFYSLSNSIKIEKQVISIPRMTISTNVMDLDLMGDHTFNDIIDYHFNFRLRDVLVKNKNQEEFGPVKDDGLGVKFFVHVFGDLDDLNYELDKEERKLDRKENIEEEKTNMKQILKEEFGLFKNDSTLQEKKEEEKVHPEFKISWDEFDEDSTVNETNESLENDNKKKEKEKKKNKWLEKLGVQEEDKNKTQFQLEN